MNSKKSTFAICFGNRGFFPASLHVSARKEMAAAMKKLGHKTFVMDVNATPHGAVETPREGEIFAKFLEKNRGKYDGVILCLPNFGDETGAIAALKDCGVPILIQAYPDELDRMSPDKRRDAFCGKFSVMDVFCQYELPFTALTPHVVHPASEAFASNIDYFDRLCRVVNGMKEITVGAVGARTTAFKTVRIDELALQRYNITCETLDLSQVFARVEKLKNTEKKVIAKAKILEKASTWKGVPQKAFNTLSKLAVVLDEIVEEYQMDCLAIRCWTEMQQLLGISPCILLGLLNDQDIATACEVDLGNAITMRALNLASGEPAICLDWNNNYGDDENKCIVFHCGPVAPSLMTGKGKIACHAILDNVLEKDCSWGCNQGHIKPMDMTYGSMITLDGELNFYLGEGRITDDPIPEDFFGCAGVVEIENLQEKLQTIGYMGHRHHVSLSPKHVMALMNEAFEKYLGYDVVCLYYPGKFYFSSLM